jgi:hypothetical protein
VYVDPVSHEYFEIVWYKQLICVNNSHNFCIAHAIRNSNKKTSPLTMIYTWHCASGITVHFDESGVKESNIPSYVLEFTSIFCPLGMYPLEMRSQSSAMCFFSFWHSAGISRLLLGGTACSLLDLDSVVLKRWVTAASTCSSQPCAQWTACILLLWWCRECIHWKCYYWFCTTSMRMGMLPNVANVLIFHCNFYFYNAYI